MNIGREIEFVGGSQDGNKLEVSLLANCILRFPFPTGQRDTLDPEQPLDPGQPLISCEEYEYKIDGRYHFRGYK